MSFDSRKLSYQVFTSRWPMDSTSESDYKKLYQCWHSIWAHTFNEIKGQAQLHSDEFDRMGEVVGLYREKQVIGVFCYNWFNLTLPSHANHSYFAAYPEAALNKLKFKGAKTVMTMGYLGVVPEWRKFEKGLFSEALLGLACKRFLVSDADFLIATTRNERKVNNLCYRHGAECLVAGHTQHNVSVDVIAVSRESAVIAEDQQALSLIENLWENRVVHGETVHGQVDVRQVIGQRVREAA